MLFLEDGMGEGQLRLHLLKSLYFSNSWLQSGISLGGGGEEKSSREGRGGRDHLQSWLQPLRTTWKPPPQEHKRNDESSFGGKGDDESYEVLVLTEYVRRYHWCNQVFGHSSGPMVEQYSVAPQIAIGGVTGCCVGFLFQKVGKLAAVTI